MTRNPLDSLFPADRILELSSELVKREPNSGGLFQFYMEKTPRRLLAAVEENPEEYITGTDVLLRELISGGRRLGAMTQEEVHKLDMATITFAQYRKPPSTQKVAKVTKQKKIIFENKKKAFPSTPKWFKP